MRSGNYEVDADGNLVEVGGAAARTAVGDRADAAIAADPADAPPPVPVRRAMRIYGFAQLVSFTLILVLAARDSGIRPVLLFVALVYAVVGVFLHRFYRRVLTRRYEKRSAGQEIGGGER